MPPVAQVARDARARSAKLREHAQQVRRAAQEVLWQARLTRALVTWRRLLLRIRS
jgi:hypothetical protein